MRPPPITLRQQLLLGALLALSTGVGIFRIAEVRNEAAVGAGAVHRFDATRPEERAAFARILATLTRLGQDEVRGRLEAAVGRGALWVAPRMGPERWALYVSTFGLVRRIYVRERALLAPESHLFPDAAPQISQAKQAAFATLSLAGALYHELEHYDGIEQEADAYAREIAWLESLATSSNGAGLSAEEQEALEWGIESAVLSAKKARGLAAATPAG